MEEKLRMEMEIVVTQEDIDDIMCSALEGGINYWCDTAKVPEEKRVARWGHEQIARDGELHMHLIEPFDDDDTEWYILTKERFIGGLEKYLKEPNHGCLEMDGKHLVIDAGNIDANAADMIVQYALFGEIVFG
ncbi:MAG: hypothetical protein ACI4EO_01875 [Blautia sp.]